MKLTEFYIQLPYALWSEFYAVHTIRQILSVWVSGESRVVAGIKEQSHCNPCMS
jgi:hypothetical protein